jgi:hypothetical protein
MTMTDLADRGPDHPDPDVAEEFAEQVGVDPTPQEVERYRQLAGDEPLGDPPAPEDLAAAPVEPG